MSNRFTDAPNLDDTVTPGFWSVQLPSGEYEDRIQARRGVNAEAA